ncbi:metal-sensitive transcriptional regulator [Bacillaceae bacterium W0354]
MEYDAKIKNRIKRLEGQLRGILRMMEDGAECKEVITQLTASRSAIDRTIGVIVSSNLIACVLEANENGDQAEDYVKEAVELLVKSR